MKLEELLEKLERLKELNAIGWNRRHPEENDELNRLKDINILIEEDEDSV